MISFDWWSSYKNLVLELKKDVFYKTIPSALKKFEKQLNANL